MTTFRLEIITPERVVYRDEVTGVTMPTIEGEITVLANHLPIVTVLKPGELVIRKGSEEHPYAIGGGFVEVQGTKLVILADTAEHVSEIDEQRAEEARQRAEQLRAQVNEDDVEYTRIAAKLERDLNRLRIVRKHRHHAHQAITQEGVRKDE